MPLVFVMTGTQAAVIKGPSSPDLCRYPEKSVAGMLSSSTFSNHSSCVSDEAMKISSRVGKVRHAR